MSAELDPAELASLIRELERRQNAREVAARWQPILDANPRESVLDDAQPDPSGAVAAKEDKT